MQNVVHEHRLPVCFSVVVMRGGVHLLGCWGGVFCGRACAAFGWVVVWLVAVAQCCGDCVRYSWCECRARVRFRLCVRLRFRCGSFGYTRCLSMVLVVALVVVLVVLVFVVDGGYCWRLAMILCVVSLALGGGTLVHGHVYYVLRNDDELPFEHDKIIGI